MDGASTRSPVDAVAKATFLIVALALPGAPAAADQPTVAGLLLAREDGSCCEAAPSLGTAAHLRVTGALVRAEVTQVFLNPTERWLEAVYVFPLPAAAAVDGFRMRVGERTIEGRIEENRAAQDIYDAAASSGRKASLLERGSPDLFRLSLANLGPGETVEVTLIYQHEVAYRDGRFSLRFPTVAPPRYGQATADAPPLLPAAPRPGGASGPAIPVGLRVDLDAGCLLAEIVSPTHALRVEDLPGGRHTITLAGGMVPADGDFSLEWTPAIGDRVLTSITVEELDGERYVLALLVPPPIERREALLARDVVFVIDTSNSMAEGGSLASARIAVNAALGRLRPTDRFNVIRFSDHVEAAFEDSRPADPVSVFEAREFVARLEVDGGTQMLPALERALQGGYSAWGTVRQVVFLTDGQVDDPSGFLALLHERAGDTRLFPVGIGPAPSSRFMRNAAAVGRGTATFLDDPTRAGADMEALLRKLEGPFLVDLRVGWGAAVADVRPDPIPDLYGGQPIVLVARLRGPSDLLEIAGTTARGPWRLEVPLAGAGANVDEASGISKLWAQREIEALEVARIEGAHPDDVRERTLRLALRHGLATSYTSFVAVDTTPTAPEGLEAERRSVPVGPLRPGPPPAVSTGQGSIVAECLTVTSESPLMDVRRISRGTTISQIELKLLPWAGSPWSLAQRSSGVFVDRVDVGGARSHLQPQVLSAGDEGTAPGVRLDGLDVTPLDPRGGLSLLDLAFLPLEQVGVTVGGADPGVERAGPTLDLTLSRGSTRQRGTVWLVASDDGVGGEPVLGDAARTEVGGLDSLRALGVEAGGALVQDRLWGWLGGSSSRVDTTALGGQDAASALDHAAVKLNAQPAGASSMRGVAHSSERDATGFGAGPTRAPEATLQDGAASRLYQIEGTQVFTADFYLTASAGFVGRDATSAPASGSGHDLAVDAAGVQRAGAVARDVEESVRSGEVQGQWFLSRGAIAHEVAFGASRADGELEVSSRSPGRGLAVLAGERYGLAGATEVLAAWRDGDVGARALRHALWLGDTLSRGSLTAKLGLRWDLQQLDLRGGSIPANPYDPRLPAAVAGGSELASADTLSPRLGLTWNLGAARRHLLSASLARFAGRLDGTVVTSMHPLRPAVSYSLFDDGDGDLTADPGELAGARFVVAEGVDPAFGGPVGAVSSDLGPEITDEAVLAYQWAVRPEAVVGLTVAARRSGRVLEERYLVHDPATGTVRVATADDWVSVGVVSGALPDGTLYEAPYFDLRPGLEWTGGRLLTNGERERESISVTLDWTRRLVDRWMGHGHVTWSEGSWRVPSTFARFDDPTPEAGGGEVDGQTVVVGGAGGSAAVQAGWSAFAGGVYRLPGDFTVGGSITAREGLPVVYYRPRLREGAGLVDVAVTSDPAARRTDALVDLDARLAKELEVAWGKVELALEAFNLLDERVVTAREGDLGVTRAGAANEVLTPRTVRLSLRLSWY